MSFMQGKNGSVKIGATALPTTEWSFNDTCPAVDTSNMLGAGFETNLDGLRVGDVSCKVILDTTLLPYGAINCVSGNQISFTFLGNNANGVNGNARVTSVKYNAPVAGVVTWDLEAKTNGAYTFT